MDVLIQRFTQDARHFQIFYLGSFLLASFLLLDRNDYLACSLVLVSALMAQSIAFKIVGVPSSFSTMKSALITGLGICLLLKTNHWGISILAVTVAIASKFLIRYRGKHIFNPVNIGLVLTILLSDNAWISPGQWGSSTLIIFVLGALGFLVLTKAERLDIACTFLLAFGGLLFVKNVLYLGWPIDFWVHQLSNGTLMLFTFFMITDPMTTPNHRKGRILYAILIAIGAFLLSSEFYFYTAPIYVLFVMSAFTPLADRIWKAQKYQWNNPHPNPSPKGRGFIKVNNKSLK